MSPYVRTVKTGSGARAVQIVHSSHRGARDIEHIGSAHDDAELELLKAVARQRVQAGQGEFDLGLDQVGSAAQPGAALPITSTRMRHLTDALTCAFTGLGLDVASGGDEVFAALVLARIIEPTSKLDSLRVLEEAGVSAPSYSTVKRHLPAFAADDFREALSAVCAAHAGLGPGVLVLYDVTTLYFETDVADEFRVPGFSKERRLEPQITIGLLVDASGFSADGAGLRGQQGRDHIHVAHHRSVQGHAPALRCHHRRRRRNGLHRHRDPAGRQCALN